MTTIAIDFQGFAKRPAVPRTPALYGRLLRRTPVPFERALVGTGGRFVVQHLPARVVGLFATSQPKNDGDCSAEGLTWSADTLAVVFDSAYGMDEVPKVCVNTCL